MFHKNLKYYAFLLILTGIGWVRAGYCEAIPLQELLKQLGLRPLQLELVTVKKGGCLTAAVNNPKALSKLGVTGLRKEVFIRLRNLGSQYWVIEDPTSGRQVKIWVRRQNRPAVHPRLRIQQIELIPGRTVRKKTTGG